MAINKVKIATERQKMKLKAEILSARVRQEELRVQLAQKKEQLRQMSQK